MGVQDSCHGLVDDLTPAAICVCLVLGH